jgi:hypothetical protein
VRALCGAIITAAALIGMGLTAQGIGTRYQIEPAYRYSYDRDKQSDEKPKSSRTAEPVKLNDMDKPLIFTLAFLTCMALVGLGIAFVGLAYHHHRREREYQLEKERASMHHRTTV